ncbi:acetolactate synthase-1/2/3 large subunit [Pseudomonas sp. ok272]|uniref:5-guanidino-2-oxopentanoate decarboxylase n=1 Tax=unclassified Pseudomonas TaxID=196821 RepID=UPI0008C9C67F|nr:MULTISPECIES: 5-guanidino-2-oxopentanoate decarboxylase [unclassified Pseudomonas]SEM38854.1 acetolactate synthase-1/2/3 large subunit [Pseudomonas sp. ok272]SFM39689.1 acetolactate synthase-1/2/3 large subunit [Pseudomonas sp. ok602]
MTSCAQALVRLLEGYGVDSVFGIPGVHTVELYRGLHGSSLRHISPRHEQGAGFMADGYARASGKPGVCFIITGPGMTNILTAMGQAYADSVPMLVISTTSRREHQRLGHGYLHEMPDQRAVVSGVCAFSHTLQRPQELPEVLARAFALFSCARPRPVHIEIPLDVLEMSADGLDLRPRTLPQAPAPAAVNIAAASQLLAAARKPLILAGGGARNAGPVLQALAERLQAPVALTTNARGLLAPEHPLLLDGVQSSAHGRALFAEADVVLAVGTELGETDYDFFGLGPLVLNAPLIRLDIDPLQILGAARADVGLLGDAEQGLLALLDVLPQSASSEWAAASVARVNAAERAGWSPKQNVMQQMLDTLRDSLPAPIVVGDSTQPVYQGALGYRAPQANSWFNAGTGFGTLGYGLPAAIGAKLAMPDRPVVAVVGDGGVQFSSAELIAAREAGAGVIVVLWNNHCYAEIRDYMTARDIPPLGVDILPPDFAALAKSCHVQHLPIRSREQLREVLTGLADTRQPVLLELDAAAFLSA